jgi:methionyl-tRNA synthetase
MENLQLRKGLLSAFALSALGNQYLQHTEPWVLLKTDAARCSTVITYAVNLVRLVTAVVEPFIPGFADKVAHQLNLDHASIPDAFSLDIPVGHELNDVVPLFRPVCPAPR